MYCRKTAASSLNSPNSLASRRRCWMLRDRFIPRLSTRVTKRTMSRRCTKSSRAAAVSDGRNRAMLTEAQRAAYERDGVIIVPDVFSPAEMAELRRVTDEFVANSVKVTANDEIYDLEDTHSAAEPRVRR